MYKCRRRVEPWTTWSGANPAAGARFSKVPWTFRVRKAIRKFTTCLFCKTGLFICCKENKNKNNCKVSCLETPSFWAYKENYVTRNTPETFRDFRETGPWSEWNLNLAIAIPALTSWIYLHPESKLTYFLSTLSMHKPYPAVSLLTNFTKSLAWYLLPWVSKTFLFTTRPVHKNQNKL